MPDHLHLSLWLRGVPTLLLPATFKKVLDEFPFSKLRPEVTLRVLALDFTEPPLLEKEFDSALDTGELASSAQDFLHEDAAFELEAHWELWRWDGEWSLKPSPVILDVYGPQFDSPTGEHVKLDLGLEDLFLPEENAPASLRPVQSNLRSVLRLISDLEGVLTVEKKMLWSDSGEDFLERLTMLQGT